MVPCPTRRWHDLLKISEVVCVVWANDPNPLDSIFNFQFPYCDSLKRHWRGFPRLFCLFFHVLPGFLLSEGFCYSPPIHMITPLFRQLAFVFSLTFSHLEIFSQP